eukprot:jgi/Phyca11/133039/e_gw1.304.6.1
MWDTIVADKTQRDFSYVSLLKGQLYATKHSKGQPMAEYLATMNRIRQQLRSMGTQHAVSDQEMLSVLTMGQFSNALLSKDERMRMAEVMNGGVAVSAGTPQAVMSATSMNAEGKKKSKANGGAWRKWKCYHCGKTGHFRRDCWHYLNKTKKATDDGKKEVEKK